MQGRGLTITAVILAILAGLLWWSNREKAKEESKPAAADVNPKILTVPVADVQKIEVKKFCPRERSHKLHKVKRK